MARPFLIMYRPGPSWLVGKPLMEQPLREHGFYMHRLWQAGKLLHGGPFMDDSGGAAVVLCADEHEARSVIEQDPAVIDGIFVAEAHPWYMVEWESFGQGAQGAQSAKSS